MQDIHVRIDDELAGRLQELAAQDEVPVSSIVRKAVRTHVERTSRADPSLARAREDTGRVR
jgi:predicted transcriptional regulator